jgi:plastocyanin
MAGWKTWTVATLAACGLGVLDAPLLPDGTSAAAADGAVEIRIFSFKPSPLSVPKGATVTWTNGDDITHTVTSGAPGQKDARFEGRLAGKGTTFSHTFGEPGTYQYHCERHQAMTGEIVVK